MVVDPDKKYEEDGGPSLDRIAGILQTAAETVSLPAGIPALIDSQLARVRGESNNAITA